MLGGWRELRVLLWERSERMKVLFLCTGNSCRSQMAEGFARAMGEEACSAGTQPKGLDLRAVRVMREVGIDISGHASKRVEEVAGSFDLVVTVCDRAHEACPVFAGARVEHRSFDDPPRLAAGAGSEEEALGHYRRVRDEIGTFVGGLLGKWVGQGTNLKFQTSDLKAQS